MPAVRLVIRGKRERDHVRAWLDTAPDLSRVTLDEPQRSHEQNRALWAALDDVWNQRRDFFGPAVRSAEDLKVIFLHALDGELRMATGADGKSFVPLGRSSSSLSHKEFGDLLTLIHAWGAEHGIQWTDPEARRAA